MDSLLKFLNGKKTIFVGVLALVVTYLVAEQIIDSNLAYLLNGIVILLGGTASVATKKMESDIVVKELK